MDKSESYPFLDQHIDKDLALIITNYVSLTGPQEILSIQNYFHQGLLRILCQTVKPKSKIILIVAASITGKVIP
jgi:hypothetical protein